MPLQFVTPSTFSTHTMADRAGSAAWLIAQLKAGGFVSDRLLTEGEMLIGTSVPQGLQFKIAVEDNSVHTTGGFMPDLSPDASVISVQVMDVDEVMKSFYYPLNCDGGTEYAVTFPGHLFTTRAGQASGRTNVAGQPGSGNCRGWSIQAGIPSVIMGGGDCPTEAPISRAFWSVGDTAYVPAPTLGGYGWVEATKTFREHWVIPANGNYSYAWGDHHHYHAAGAYYSDGYGNIGQDPYGTPRLLPWEVMNGYGMAYSQAPLDWRPTGTEPFLPSWYEAMILFGGTSVSTILRGQTPNCIWSTVPTQQNPAIDPWNDWYNLINTFRDPLDRVSPHYFGDQDGICYSDPTTVDGMDGSLQIMKMLAGGEGLRNYAH